MKMEELENALGRRASINLGGITGRACGIIGRLISSSGIEYILRFDNGKMGKITDKNVHLIQLDLAN